MAEQRSNRRSRRDILKAAGALVGCGALAPFAAQPALATPATMEEAVRNFVGESPVTKGKVKLDIPPIVENGNSVPCAVSVESAMTGADYVKAIHIFNERIRSPTSSA